MNNQSKQIYGRIYKITNLVNGKIYVGQTIRPINIRFSNHVSQSKAHEYPISKAIRKYGRENFKIDEIDNAFSKEELDEKEVAWIDELNSTNNKIGYNRHRGGQKHGGIPHTEEDKYKLRITAMAKTGFQGVFNNRHTYTANLVINGENHFVYGIKEFNDALEVRDMMTKYYLGKNAVLNLPDADTEPLSVNDARKYVRYLNEKILYSGVSRRNGRYAVRIKIGYDEVVSLTFKTQLDGAYVFDYYNRLYDFDKHAINFPDIVLNRDDIIEIVKRNKGIRGSEVNYAKL